MNDKIISGRALNALAFLVAEVRRRTGGTDWQEPGILDALARATDHARCTDAGTLAMAAIRAASDGRNRTPAVIALDGAHWDERLKPPERKITMGTDVTVCPQCRRIAHPGELCARRLTADERAEALLRGFAQVESPEGWTTDAADRKAAR